MHRNLQGRLCKNSILNLGVCVTNFDLWILKLLGPISPYPNEICRDIKVVGILKLLGPISPYPNAPGSAGKALPGALGCTGISPRKRYQSNRLLHLRHSLLDLIFIFSLSSFPQISYSYTSFLSNNFP